MANEGATTRRQFFRLAVSRGKIAIAAGLLVIAVLAVYSRCGSVPFLLDDASSITKNPTIDRLGSAFFPPQNSTVGGRPLLNLSFALNHALNGERLAGYHLFNEIIHALVALVLFGTLRRTLVRPAVSERFRAAATGLALGIAALWALHPVQTESVTYISQRAESLMALFYLLTLYCFIRGIESARAAAWKVASILACLMGAMCKEPIMTAPVIVFLYDRTFVAGSWAEAWRRRWRYYLGLASSWLLLAALMRHLSQRAAGFHWGVTGWSYALTSCRSVALYLKLAFWPYPLVFDYGPVFIHRIAQAAPYAVLLAGLLGLVIMALRRWPAVGFAGACFFVILSPTSSVVPIAFQPMAENRLYLPLAALLAPAVIGLYAWAGRHSLIVVSVAALGLGGMSVARNRDYRSALSLWSDTVAKRPDNPRAQLNLADALARTPGRMAEAFAHYEQALRLDPNYLEAHNNFAAELAKIPARVPEALAHYEQAMRLNPRFAEAYYNAAVVLAKLPGRTPEAIARYEQALQIDPNYAKAHNNLANVLAKIPGRRSEALAHYQAALRIDPNHANAHYNLANELMQIPGRESEALAHYRAALRIDPDYAEAHNNLANALAKLPGRTADAIAHYQAALRLNPNYAQAHKNLAEVLARMPGRRPEAVAEYQQALRIEPDDAVAHDHLAVLLAKMPGRTSEAMAHYEQALRIDPNYVEAHNNLANELAKMPGRIDDAVAHYEQALRVEPRSARTHYNLAVVLAKISPRASEAVSQYEAAVQIDPNFAEAQYNLANELEKIPGRMPEALVHYEAALRLKPDNAEAQNNLAVAYALAGRFDDAVTHWQIALKLDPSLTQARDNLSKLQAMRKAATP